MTSAQRRNWYYPGRKPGVKGEMHPNRLGGRHRFSSLLRLRAATSILQEKARSPLALEYDDRAMSTASSALKTALFTLFVPAIVAVGTPRGHGERERTRSRLAS